jgi:hypothetical protein
MRTVGVDLAAEPKKTALAVVDWSDGVARVESVRLGAGNDAVTEAVLACDKAGIDAPFGWPDAFVRMVSDHHAGGRPATSGLANRDGRRPLTKRRTDLVVQAATGISPLSVSADLIAHVALRCAGLLAELGDLGVDVGRVDGRVVEAYPAAALRIWGLTSRGYKSAQNRVTLGGLVDTLLAAAPSPNGKGGSTCRREACSRCDPSGGDRAGRPTAATPSRETWQIGHHTHRAWAHDEGVQWLSGIS